MQRLNDKTGPFTAALPAVPERLCDGKLLLSGP
jgi:hypothetical protein